jgi:endonuclease YncB( thermonuclease family)
VHLIKSFILFTAIWVAGCGSTSTDDVIVRGLEGKVISIADGDTFTILEKNNKQKKIRLYGIDCPEKKQAFGNVAKKQLGVLLFGKQVIVQSKNKDRFGRIVGIVFANGININEELLRSGMAWHFIRYDNNPSWQRLEEEARKAKRGLWSLNDPVAPWKWRKQPG